MSNQLIRLYPSSINAESDCNEPLQGLYLRHARLAANKNQRPIVFANFLSSLDGRIAIAKGSDQGHELPVALKSEEDFILLMELYSHADCIITHGGYMRSLAAGKLGNVLQIPDADEFQYLHDWRAHQGLSAQPDVVILSGSGEFPWHPSLDQHGQQVHIVSGGQANPEVLQQWQNNGHQVYRMGDQRHVEVHALMNFLQQQDYRSVYLMAGPDLLQDLLAQGYVDHFFMTLGHQLLAGKHYKSLLSGDVLGDNGKMILQSLYMNPESSNGCGQWYAEFTFKNHT